MQPRTLAIVVTLLPLLAVNGAYLMSAWHGHVTWCIPYIHGCTTISQAGRSGDTLFLFRALFMVQAVLLAWYWWYAKQWLDYLNSAKTVSATIIFWLGSIGALFLILYMDFLGTDGDMNRFMRRQGVLVYFTFTPLAQLLLYNQLHKLKAVSPALLTSHKALRFQLAVLVLMLLTGIISLIINYSGNKTYQSENIIEWNFSLLLALYFAGNIVLWKNLKFRLHDT